MNFGVSMNNCTLITCNYNTPEVLLTMLKSFVPWYDTSTELLIIDNSTDLKTSKILNDNNIKFYPNYGNCHGNGVNKALEICKTKYALLVDTDIIFNANLDDFIDICEKCSLTLFGTYQGSECAGKQLYPRINPWFCFINVENIRKFQIKFFDEERTKASFKTDKLYDVGSTFFEDIKKHELNFAILKDVIAKDYYAHFSGLSWNKQKYNPNNPDTHTLDWDINATHNNTAIYNAGLAKEQHYLKVIENFKNVSLKNKFTFNNLEGIHYEEC
jgi:hypothetical protein